MSESTMKLLGLLRDDATIETIKKEMNLTSSQLAYRLSLLQSMGYAVQKKYYANGDITACLSSDLAFGFYDKTVDLYTKTDENSIRILVISDLHFFHKDEDRMALQYVYEYCIKKGIHIILNCGDLIDCMENNEVPIEKQAETFIELYPQDDHIINFCVLGNHDAMFIKKCNMDFKRILESKRLDIVPISYLESRINIKKDKIYLNHPIPGLYSYFKSDKGGSCLNFYGHSHTAKVKETSIYVPSLSNVRVDTPKEFAFVPQALDVTISFNSQNATIKSAVISQLIVGRIPFIIGEYYISLNNMHPYSSNLEVDEYPSLRRVK